MALSFFVVANRADLITIDSVNVAFLLTPQLCLQHRNIICKVVDSAAKVGNGFLNLF